MMTSIETYVRKGQVQLRQWVTEPRVRLAAKVTGVFFAGFLLSAASLANSPQPLVMSLLLAMEGWMAPVLALGGALGYGLLWERAGLQGIAWVLAALPASIPGVRRLTGKWPLFSAALGGVIVAGMGLIFQIWLHDTTPIAIYLLRTALGASAVMLFRKVLCRGDPAADWMAQGIAVLALGQFQLFPGGNLGCIAAGMLAAWGTFPAAALAGLALDLARISPTPMTAVLCLSFLTRLLPIKNNWAHRVAPGILYLAVMGLCNVNDPLPAIGLAIGGAGSLLLPPIPKLSHRRGETGVAQVHLELMASALSQTQQLLLETPDLPIDESALLARTRERACASCPGRRTCVDRLDPIPDKLLHTVLTDTSSLPLSCKKPGRMILELRRTQEQFRLIRADRRRQQEYRSAIIQQYQFLSEFLREQADLLPYRASSPAIRYEPEVKIATSGREADNGDRCICFHGTQGRYFVLLCDGMGTGIGAAQDGQNTASLLRQMLSAGFPAPFALRSVNSLLVLRGKSAAATIDLAEFHLDTGRGNIYKWGASPSLLLREDSVERIGVGGPPPGLAIEEGRETVDRVSLRRGETLVLLSDGVETESAVRHLAEAKAMSSEKLASRILQWGVEESQDDATVAVLRLKAVP